MDVLNSRQKVKIKKGDNVLVIAGKDKGKKGKVEKVIIKKGKLIVGGINILKKHTKPSTKNRQGGIIEFAAPINISNVMLLCGACNKPTKIKHKVLDKGSKDNNKNQQKIRICQKCNEGI